MSAPSSSNNNNNNNSDWCTIESDPAVFTELLETIGCGSVELTELWSLDTDALALLMSETAAVYGFIFLFEYKSDLKNTATTTAASSVEEANNVPDDLFFAHQVATNACATQAILSVVLNTVPDPGPLLTEFATFTASFPAPLKGVSIASSEPLQKAHNAFARADAFLGDTLDDKKKWVDPDKGEAFHFVAYIPFKGTVYCLDGLQKGPLVVGTYNESDHDDDTAAAAAAIPSWIPVARTAIQERMQAAEGIGKFNLMAVIQDKRIKLADDAFAVQAQQAKRELWKVENERRRHNYVPLVVQLLKELARQDKLTSLVSAARERRSNKA